jgi:hypothetical protein
MSKLFDDKYDPVELHRQDWKRWMDAAAKNAAKEPEVSKFCAAQAGMCYDRMVKAMNHG